MQNKQIKYQKILEDFIELQNMGFEVKQFTLYHFRISKYGVDLELDIFPTRKHLCRKTNKSITRKEKYVDLIDTVESLLR